ncbi:hypothetical protein QA644_08000 [Rhizobium sp. CC1099]|uniref:hypothetical protein n=1 Tax=Rhizobium sp. CC1099 TaxID=3039160 RepID=UPI0024B03CB1|nr:hypothetical protein [Rhizobium sp. CC1099]WFU88971.1 hypothetical protein QA644_08000 [Rhizobium sp. CC1099]
MSEVSSISELWEDSHFLHWEAVEEKTREPIEDSKARFDAVGGIDEGRAWLLENDIDPDKLPFQPKLVRVAASRDFDLQHIENPCGRTVFEFDDEGIANAIVFPIIDHGQTIDFGILFIEDFEFCTVRQKAIWLGGDNIDGDEVRLHSCVSDWLEAGAEGCVYIDEQRRTPLKRLQSVDKILCNDIAWALEVWDWAFEADEAALERFEIDDTRDNIEAYFKAQAERRVISDTLNKKHAGRFNLVVA